MDKKTSLMTTNSDLIAIMTAFVSCCVKSERRQWLVWSGVSRQELCLWGTDSQAAYRKCLQHLR